MSKSLKRQAKSKLNDNVLSKTPKYYDLNLITKDISMLESFYDFIDSENDIINEYLTDHDLNDFLNYFKSNHLYKPSEFALVFKVGAEILMRIAGDLNEKYSLIGQNFADLFVENYKAIIHQYLIKNKAKSTVKSCVKFVTALILQGSDVALKIVSSFNIFIASFSQQLLVRSHQEDDVHTCILNCFASFFVLGSNVIIRKLCEYKPFFDLILRDLRFDKYDNVQLMIEILNDKVIKNNGISKTIKVKLFNPTTLNYLICVYDWKGEAKNYDSFQHLNTIDERCGSIHNQLHQLMLDICSNNFGIAFTDNLCGQSKSNILNKSLYKLIISSNMNNFLTHPMKNEIVKTVLRNCPDLIPSFLEHLATQIIKLVPVSRTGIMKVTIDCYELLENNKLDNILTESLGYENGEKFADIAALICGPSQTMIDVVKTTQNVSYECTDCLNGLKKSIMHNCERVLTWINVSESVESPEQRMQLISDFQQKIKESLVNCGWNDEYENMFSKECKDTEMFMKTVKEYKNIDCDTDKVSLNLNEEIDEDLKICIKSLTDTSVNDTVRLESFKKCCKHFLKSPFTSITVLVAIADCLCTNTLSLKKKFRRKLFDAMVTSAVIEEYWPNPYLSSEDTEDIEKKELIRNSIFDVIVSCVDSSSGMMLAFYETVHPMRLLSIYGGTMSHCDQKIMYLLSVHQLYDTSVPSFDVILFGHSVNEHYLFESTKSAQLSRPIIVSQCFNLLIDEKMAATINQFPINRRSPVSKDNKIHLDQSYRSIYDPCFLLEWISQMLAQNCDSDNDQWFQLGQTIELKVLHAKRIVQFLVVCQSSHSDTIRLVSKTLLGRLLDRLSDADNKANEHPMKMQIQMILYHLFNSLGQSKEGARLPSVFTNIYTRILQLLNSPDKKIFSPLWEMIISKEFFDINYVPDYHYMLYSDKDDYRTRRLWCLQLLADSVKDYEDFLVVVNTRAMADVLALYPMLDQCSKTVVLTMVRRSVAIPRVALWLRKYPGFVAWLMYTGRSGRPTRDHIEDIIRALLKSLATTTTTTTMIDDVTELEKMLALPL